MPGNRRLREAFHKYEVPFDEILERIKALKDLNGPEKEEQLNLLAEWIETSCPVKRRKPSKRKLSKSEMNAVDVVFNDSIRGSLIQARRDYEALEYGRIVALPLMSLDVGSIGESEDSNDRKIASWRLVFPYMDEPDEELLAWSEKDIGRKHLCSVLEKGDPLRIWYGENPKELCGLYYLCSQLIDYSGDVYAVRIPDRIRREKGKKYCLAFSTGQIDPFNAGIIVESAVKLSSREIRMYAEEWERLKQENAPLRTVIAGKIVSVEEDFYDRLIWKQIPAKAAKEERVCADVLKNNPYIQAGWCLLRIQEMIHNGFIVIDRNHEDPGKRLIRRRSEIDSIDGKN